MFPLNLFGDFVPVEVLTAFGAKYPGAQEVSWDFGWNGFSAHFLDGEGNEADAFFKKNGEWIETITQLDLFDLPDRILGAIKDTYVDNTIEAAAKVEQPAGICYLVSVDEIEHSYILDFDEEGNLLSKMMDD